MFKKKKKKEENALQIADKGKSERGFCLFE